MSKQNTGYLMSSFTYGFELEGWTDNTGKFRELKKFTEGFFKESPFVSFAINRSDAFHGDGSINPTRSSGSGRSSGSDECPSCDGSGRVHEDCEDCSGRGYFEESCERCGGSGRRTNSEGVSVTCSTCNGSGQIREECCSCDGSGHHSCECDDCDGSGSFSRNAYAFEWSSPVFNVIPKNVVDTIRYLKTVSKEYMHTNSSCGFHIHVGFPEKLFLGPQMLWLLVKLASDEGSAQYEEILKFDGMNMFNERYATNKIVYDIRRIKDRVCNEREFMSILLSSCYSDNKYQVLRIHPQGTFEWRGPRGFLDKKDPKQIAQFFMQKFVPFVKWMSNALASDTATFGEYMIIKKELLAYIKECKTRSPVESDHEATAPKRKTDRFNWREQDVTLLPQIFAQFPWLKKAKFRNAVISLGSRNNLLWKNGEWLSGEWVRGTWFNGTFSGTWKTGVFRGGSFSGEWQSGRFLGGQFLNGQFLNGQFNHAEWLNGDFLNGKFENSKWQNGTFCEGTFVDSTWTNGEFKGGKFLNSDWYNGAIHRKAEVNSSKLFRVWKDAETQEEFRRVSPNEIWAMTPEQLAEYKTTKSTAPSAATNSWIMYTIEDSEVDSIIEQMRSLTSDEINSRLSQLREMVIAENPTIEFVDRAAM